MRYIPVLLLPIVLLACGQNQSSTDPVTPHLGVVSLEVTGHPDALPHFERGLLLLHNFEYEDASAAFDSAFVLDPRMPMALWGIAMCENFPIWRYENYETGRMALDSLDPIQRDITELEQDLIGAVKLLFADDISKEERDLNYRDAMARLYGKYPNSDDVAAFYALAILGTVKETRDYDTYEEAAAIAKKVVDRSPNHPGGLHYYIHAYDDPLNAHKALDQAYAYAKVAPDAAHALHMPSHIFLPLGLWDDLIASNTEAWQASHNRRSAKQLENDALDFHSLHWLQYGYLQLGQADTAAAMVQRMAAYTDSLPGRRARNHLIFMQATYCAETGDYLHPIAAIEVDLNNLDITSRTQRHWVAGMRAFQQNDLKALTEMYATIETECRREALFLDTADFKICMELDRSMPRQIDIDRSLVMAMQLRAHEALLQGDLAGAEEGLRKASDFEISLDLYYGPPQIRKPSPELYADWLLAQGRFAEAKTLYKVTLERAPGRRNALMGIQSAAPGIRS